MSVNLLDLVKNQISPEMISQLAGKVGADPQSAGNAINNILPSLIGGLSRNAANPDGAASLWSALDRDHDGSVLNDLTGLLGGLNPQKEQEGDKIVNHILGDDRQAVESGISESSGLNVSQIGGLMSSLAPMLMGMLGQQKNQGGLDIGGLMSLLGGQKSQLQNSGAGGVLGMLSGFLDKDKDGDIMDDISGMIGGFLKK